MIDIALLRKNENNEQELLTKKAPSYDIGKLLKLDSDVRSFKTDIENLRKERNELAKQGAQGITDEVRQKSIEIGKSIKAKETELEKLQEELTFHWQSSPNIPYPDLPVGGKEANKPIKVFGQKPEFNFEPKNHLELNKALGWFDFDRATAMSGTHFAMYRKEAVKLMYVLTDLMIKHNASYGFEPVIPPYLVNPHALVNSGNLPKFADDVFRTQDGQYLIPTAEVSLTNMHAKSIIPGNELPVRYTSWTSCFRREAGGYGAQDRGLIRIHQFEKVELYTISRPDESDDELERMVECAESILEILGLHFRISLLATEDCSFSSAKTYDIEVWLPGQNTYYEVSSCSNCTDFQARRAGIRYRDEIDSKPHLAHTLNASSLALPRLMVALMEQYQQADGTIKLPDVLQEKMDALW